MAAFTRFQNSSMFGWPTAASNFDNTSCKDLREVTVTRSRLIRFVDIESIVDPFIRDVAPGRQGLHRERRKSDAYPAQWVVNAESWIVKSVMTNQWLPDGPTVSRRTVSLADPAPTRLRWRRAVCAAFRCAARRLHHGPGPAAGRRAARRQAELRLFMIVMGALRNTAAGSDILAP